MDLGFAGKWALVRAASQRPGRAGAFVTARIVLAGGGADAGAFRR